MLFFNRVNSWLKDRKERTEINIITIGSTWNKHNLFLYCFGLHLPFLTIPKPLKQYTLLKKRLSISLSEEKTHAYVLQVFSGCAFPLNDIGGVASSFQRLSSGGDRGSREELVGERGGGRNATAAKSLKWPVT